MSEKNDSSNSLILGQNRSLTHYSSEILARGLVLAGSILAAKTIRLLAVDDIPETLEHYRKLLYFEHDIQIVGYGANGKEAIEQFVRLLPDVMITCINMPVMDGLVATAVIYGEYPDAKVIIASVQNAVDYRRRAFRAGAKAYLVKPFSSEEIASAIRMIARGEVHPSALVFDPESMRKYYAASNINVDGLIASLESLNAKIRGGLSDTDIRAFLCDVRDWSDMYFSINTDYMDCIRRDLGDFLRTDLQTEVESVWKSQIEEFLLDPLEEYFHIRGQYKDFRWGTVKSAILQERLNHNLTGYVRKLSTSTR